MVEVKVVVSFEVYDLVYLELNAVVLVILLDNFWLVEEKSTAIHT